MSGNISELEQFRRFLDVAIGGANRDLSVAEAVAQFETHQRQAAQFDEQIQESIQQARRGEARALDADQLKREIRDELAIEGIDE